MKHKLSTAPIHAVHPLETESPLQKHYYEEQRLEMGGGGKECTKISFWWLVAFSWHVITLGGGGVNKSFPICNFCFFKVAIRLWTPITYATTSGQELVWRHMWTSNP